MWICPSLLNVTTVLHGARDFTWTIASLTKIARHGAANRQLIPKLRRCLRGSGSVFEIPAISICNFITHN
jgi:hypothetical protein